jgi:glycosyltransferase involved in cell wall biosynthesis
MKTLPIFLTVVMTIRNEESRIESIVSRTTALLKELVSDYEILIIDNASLDNTLERLKALSLLDTFPNLQIYGFIKEADIDAASAFGIESALGDFVAIINPFEDDVAYLPDMVNKAVSSADVVFAVNEQKPARSLLYQLANLTFNATYKWLNGISLVEEAPQYRVLSKKVVNFILQHPQPAVTYRHLPATGGFTRLILKYSYEPAPAPKKGLSNSIDRGLRLMVSTTKAPMRLVTLLCLFGAISNLIYSIYVVIIVFYKADVAPGWVSLSLQQSGMFFLLSLVLLVLAEYILNMVRLQNDGPSCQVGQEFTSSSVTRHQKINIEVVQKN